MTTERYDSEVAWRLRLAKPWERQGPIGRPADISQRQDDLIYHSKRTVVAAILPLDAAPYWVVWVSRDWSEVFQHLEERLYLGSDFTLPCSCGPHLVGHNWLEDNGNWQIHDQGSPTALTLEEAKAQYPERYSRA